MLASRAKQSHTTAFLAMSESPHLRTVSRGQERSLFIVDLAYVSNVDIGAQICDQLVDIVGRVRAARSYAVKLMVKLFRGAVGSGLNIWRVLELSAPDKLIPYLLQPEIAKEENHFSDPSVAAFDPVSEPSFPKTSVPVPDGLDLDVWIVPSMQDRVAEEGGDGANASGAEDHSTGCYPGFQQLVLIPLISSNICALDWQKDGHQREPASAFALYWNNLSTSMKEEYKSKATAQAHSSSTQQAAIMWYADGHA
ncbi:hypothetical protein EV702DRAFT_1202686 [Suillus placidus]|uniref:Uncharacterized protein n=1 Tax=Suillus placidus TaxID=48579 RepID=A0A9P7CYS0_9AGAM|nr:hypothetical protein EV702DRAFT_1202686 [Suillus placidus]